jgi:hypothetical protein
VSDLGTSYSWKKKVSYIARSFFVWKMHLEKENRGSALDHPWNFRTRTAIAPRIFRRQNRNRKQVFYFPSYPLCSALQFRKRLCSICIRRIRKTSGMAYISGRVLAPIITAAPATMAVAKISIPETGDSLMMSVVHLQTERTHFNAAETTAAGAGDGIHLASTGARLPIAFIAPIALLVNGS